MLDGTGSVENIGKGVSTTVSSESVPISKFAEVNAGGTVCSGHGQHLNYVGQSGVSRHAITHLSVMEERQENVQQYWSSNARLEFHLLKLV
jgi:hypothetical protein